MTADANSPACPHGTCTRRHPQAFLGPVFSLYASDCPSLQTTHPLYPDPTRAGLILLLCSQHFAHFLAHRRPLTKHLESKPGKRRYLVSWERDKWMVNGALFLLSGFHVWCWEPYPGPHACQTSAPPPTPKGCQAQLVRESLLPQREAL